MARKKKEFHFDFNEDADPVEELHRLRVATVKHFKTFEALAEYHSSVRPVEVILADLDEKIAREREEEARAASKGKTRAKTVRAPGKPAGRRRRTPV